MALAANDVLKVQMEGAAAGTATAEPAVAQGGGRGVAAAVAAAAATSSPATSSLDLKDGSDLAGKSAVDAKTAKQKKQHADAGADPDRRVVLRVEVATKSQARLLTYSVIVLNL